MVRKIKAKLVLRPQSEGLSGRQITLQGMSRHSVDAVIAAAERERFNFDEVAGLDEAAVYARRFPGRGGCANRRTHALPNPWANTGVERNLKQRLGVAPKNNIH